MQIGNFTELRKLLKQENHIRVVIACAQEEELLLAHRAQKEELAAFTLIGDAGQLEEIGRRHGISISQFHLIDIKDHKKAAQHAMKLIHTGEADIPMKGLLHTAVFMGAVLDKQYGLNAVRRVSQITAFEDRQGGLKFLTDCAVNVDQSLKIKKDMIENAVELVRGFGYECPKVALLGAVETVNEQMEDTLISAALTQMNRRGQIKNCLIDGPLSLDNAISRQAARQKQIVSEVAGEADILVGSSLQEANTLSKSLHFYAGISTASLMMGTEKPFIMTSRTDDIENKLNSIAATCFYSKCSKKRGSQNR